MEEQPHMEIETETPPRQHMEKHSCASVCFYITGLTIICLAVMTAGITGIVFIVKSTHDPVLACTKVEYQRVFGATGLLTFTDVNKHRFYLKSYNSEQCKLIKHCQNTEVICLKPEEFKLDATIV